MPRTPPPPSPYPDGCAIPHQSLMLTIKLEGAPAAHLAYDRARRFAETAVTILDQTGTAAPLDFEDVVVQALLFVVNYWHERHEWPAELRAPGAGRRKTHEAS
jgi:hypothetical protein